MAMESKNHRAHEQSYVISTQACGIIDCRSTRAEIRQIETCSLLRVGPKSDYPHPNARRSIINIEAEHYQGYMQNEALRKAGVNDELRNAYACLLRGQATTWRISAIHVDAREISFLMRSIENDGKNPLSILTFPLHALTDGIDFHLGVIIRPRRWPWPKAKLQIDSTILEDSLLRCTTVTEHLGKHDRATGFVEYSNGTTYVSIVDKTPTKSH